MGGLRGASGTSVLASQGMILAALSFIVAFFLVALLLKALWGLLARHVFPGLVERGLVQRNLRYSTSLRFVWSIVVWIGVPVVLAVLAAWLFMASSRSPIAGFTFGIYFSLFGVPLLLAYFVLAGALWLQWCWSRIGMELFQGAFERGVLPGRLRYTSAALIMLVVTGIYVVSKLPWVILDIAVKFAR